VIVLLVAFAAPLAAQVKTYPYRWVFVIRSLRFLVTEGNVP